MSYFYLRLALSLTLKMQKVKYVHILSRPAKMISITIQNRNLIFTYYVQKKNDKHISEINTIH